MGGINHQPTRTVSEALTVPMSEALSKVALGIFGCNVSIEQAIIGGRTLSYGASRGHLHSGVTQLDGTVTQLEVFGSLVRQILGVLKGGDYEPFQPAVQLDLDAFLDQLVETGMLPDAAAGRLAVSQMREGGYAEVFESYADQAERLTNEVTVLRELTAGMADGMEGLQGLFWSAVEANKQPWRQAFAIVLTTFTGLLTSFQTSALISTETYLQGMGAPSLFSNVAEVQVPVLVRELAKS